MVKQALTQLHNKYLLVPVDEATTNVTTVCRFYALTLIKELRLHRRTRKDNNNTHETCNHIQQDLLIAQDPKDPRNNFHLSVCNENNRLPLIYRLLKLYKNSPKQDL